MARRITYAEAVTLLEPDQRLLTGLDAAIGGLIGAANAVTGGLAEPVVNLFGVKAEAMKVGQRILTGLRGRLTGGTRVDRTRGLEAAHALLVVTAFFESLDELTLPFDQRRLAVTGDEQARLAFGGTQWRTQLLHAPIPFPDVDTAMGRGGQCWSYYEALGRRLLDFVSGLAVWDELDETRRADTRLCFGDGLTGLAVRRYEELYRRLAVDIPEFGFWVGQRERRATRRQVEAIGQSLAGLAELLGRIPSGRAPDARRSALATAYRAVLGRPALTDRALPDGLRIPLLGEAYLDADFRVLSTTEELADEDSWADCDVRSDLPTFLAAYLTSGRATDAPLMVLGQPGAGKSVLTQVLAARLPAADFLPVRVVLREVPADAEIQDQIEYAVYGVTGERVTWPDLVRSAGDALPVVLLDGFDELLQATGASQSDYLHRVAAFQEREAIQGRPVAVLVTSRSAVADRTRYPDGAVAMRLEPFRAVHVESWLAVWRRTNADHLGAVGVRPLTADVALRYPDLSGQPLLLQMLALYDAEANALQRADADGIDEAGLYERLLTTFAEREIRKSGAALPDREIRDGTERELQRLSVVAFAMFNRRKQWVTANELDADLGALLPAPRPLGRSDFRKPLSQAEVVLGRFFFMQRAAAVRDNERLETYEFLHATFGEYLVARLIHQLLRDLPPQRPGLALTGPATVDDGLLWTLLSFEPLTARDNVVPFLVSMSRRTGDTGRIRAALVEAFHADDDTSRPHPGYRPIPAQLTTRLAAYRGNLVLLLLATGGAFQASDLFADRIAAEEWRRHVTRWQAEFTWSAWFGFTDAITVTRLGGGARRDLRVSLGRAEPVDPDLGWSNPRLLDASRVSTSLRSRRAAFRRLMLAGGRDADLAVHLAWPLLALPNQATVDDGSARFELAARSLLGIWIHGGGELTGDELAATYWRCADALLAAPDRSAWRRLFADCLMRDSALLSSSRTELHQLARSLRRGTEAQTREAIAAWRRRSANPEGDGSGGAEAEGK
ncbi:MAG TPA: hypothetical protein VGN37_20205 [Actinocatenispora sp.]